MRMSLPSRASARLLGALGVLGLVTISGCAGSSDGDDYPMRPGNGGGIGGGGGGGGDAGVDGPAGDGAQATGRVCLISDLRFRAPCASSLGGATIQVQRGTATITPSANGTFTLPPSSTVGDRWVVTGPNMVTSVVPFVPNEAVQLPLVTQATWDRLRQDSDILPSLGTGALHVFSLKATGGTKPMVRVSTDPAGPSLSVYAGTSPTIWGNDPGTFAASIVPNLTADQPVDVIGDSDVRSSLMQQPVAADAITYLSLEFSQ